MRSSPDRALAGDIVLCSWARHFTLTVPPSTQEYKWVPANCWGNLTNCWGVTCDGLASRPGGVEILLAASCYGNQNKLRPDGPVLAPKASPFKSPARNVSLDAVVYSTSTHGFIDERAKFHSLFSGKKKTTLHYHNPDVSLRLIYTWFRSRSYPILHE